MDVSAASALVGHLALAPVDSIAVATSHAASTAAGCSSASMEALAPCEPDSDVHGWISTRARVDTDDALELERCSNDDERARKFWTSPTSLPRIGIWANSDAPDGIRRSRSRSRTPPGVRRYDSDYEVNFRRALLSSVDRLATSSAASSSTESPLPPSMTMLVTTPTGKGHGVATV